MEVYVLLGIRGSEQENLGVYSAKESIQKSLKRNKKLDNERLFPFDEYTCQVFSLDDETNC